MSWPRTRCPASPEQVGVVRTYRSCVVRSCPKEVFDAGGRRVDTAYPGSLVALPDEGTGATFAYDPAAPTHVIPLRDFRFGRSPRGHGMPSSGRPNSTPPSADGRCAVGRTGGLLSATCQ
ncbi:MAG: hypothetical protein V9G19_22090 [Tetrasphaera sp.]